MSSVSRIGVDPAGVDDVLLAARRGDVAARWGALEACRAYLRLVASMKGWRRGDGGPDTSDVVQNAILDGWRGFSRFDGQTAGQLRAWLRVILIHALIKTRRRPRPARPECGSDILGLASSVTSPSALAQRDESRSLIDSALGKLPDHYRAAIRLRLWDDLSFAEIGERLGLSDECARKLYGRAIARLREATGPGHDPR